MGTGKERERGGVYSVCAWPQSYDHIPSHPYHAGTEHVGFSPIRQITNQADRGGGGGGSNVFFFVNGRYYVVLQIRSLVRQKQLAQACSASNKESCQEETVGPSVPRLL